MKKNILINKSASQIFFVLYLCVIALRLSFSENVSIDSFSLPGIFFDNLLSVCISCILIIVSMVWLTVMFWKGKVYKFSGLEAGAVIFFIAAIISTIYASNKRAALNDSLTISAVIISAITLVQLLETETRRKILLYVIIAAGAMNVYQCVDQIASGNKMMIEEYKANPTQQLNQLGIEPGSFAQMLYEHRLYSKDVKGYFATSNSAGSFFNLAIFSAIAVFAGGLKKYRNDYKNLLMRAVILAVLLLGLILTESKGALLSFGAAAFVLCGIFVFGKILNKYKVLIFSVIAILFIASILLMISYGLKHDRLPGGNSMLVRWEYWTAASEIIADNFLTGVGGNNFGTYYTQYKAAKSLETVRDPHCFILTIFSSYGIIGVAGFLTCLVIPIFKAMKRSTPVENENNISRMITKAAIPTVLVLLLLRPIAFRSELGGRFDLAAYIIAVLYIAPVFMFGAALWLMAKGKKFSEEFSIKKAALLCGILAVLLHNLIDFGIFEPGILTALFAVIALSASQYENQHTVQLGNSKRYIPLVLTIGVVIGCMWFYIIPVGKTAFKVETAKQLSSYGYMDNAAAILSTAIKDDVYNPTPANLKGTIETFCYKANPPQYKNKLEDANQSFLIAIARDPADFKNFEKLSEVYESMAEAYPDKCNMWFEKALEALEKALVRYPTDSEMHLKAGTLAQQLNKTDEAIEHYMQAIAIEDAYREEFKIMYPDREMFSRLGEINYNFAKQRLQQLKGN
ncbi:MAG TPA: hypothetical protein DCP47_01160 [Phycisphaerales bacterium]|nr:hypothetical protein [Phycisphaerales bacterium]